MTVRGHTRACNWLYFNHLEMIDEDAWLLLMLVSEEPKRQQEVLGTAEPGGL